MLYNNVGNIVVQHLASYSGPSIPLTTWMHAPHLPYLPLEVRRLKYSLVGLGSAVIKLPLGRIPAEIEFWCILALKFDIWW